jgi:hypothetical protein
MPPPPDFGRTSPSIVSKSAAGLPVRVAARPISVSRAVAAACRIWTPPRGIALDHPDPIDTDAELLGGHLRNRDAQPLTEIDLARKNRHRAIGIDGDEAVDVGGV